jgi:protein TonB
MTQHHPFRHAICAVVVCVMATPVVAGDMLTPEGSGFNPGVVTAQRMDLREQKPRQGAWVTAMDYPTEALQQERGSTVAVELSVDAEGRPTACRIVLSSKFAPLDARTCDVFRERARYVPARDATGNPAPGTTVERLRWVIPD